MNKKIIKVSAILAYIVMVVTNYLAVTLPLAGRSTGAISDNYPNLFAPAGYAFSIWSLIYTLLGIYVVYQLLAKSDGLVVKVSKVFILNALLNAAWIFAWHYDFIWLSLIIMLGLLITLIKIADICRTSALSQKERWLVRLPFSVYFGWITVATIANIAVFLVSINWNGFGISEVIWTSIVLVVGAIIGILRMLKDRVPAYGLVLVWAYIAILFKHSSASGFNKQYPAIIFTVAACLLLFIFSLAWIMLKKNKQSVK